MGGPSMLPYWLVNVPDDQHTDTCPEFLQNVSERDRRILSTPDSQYERLSWPQVRDVIDQNRIDLFQRVPSDLRRYHAFISKIKKDFGSVMTFVLNERLRWKSLTPSGPPFSNPDDIKILYNDWPYGIDTRIVHLVVWVKFELDDDPVTGDLTEEARQDIARYVVKTFCSRIPIENIIWFKNWKSLKSVQAVEHFHVMLFNPDMAFVKDITEGDVPLIETF